VGLTSACPAWRFAVKFESRDDLTLSDLKDSTLKDDTLCSDFMGLGSAEEMTPRDPGGERLWMACETLSLEDESTPRDRGRTPVLLRRLAVALHFLAVVWRLGVREVVLEGLRGGRPGLLLLLALLSLGEGDLQRYTRRSLNFDSVDGPKISIAPGTLVLLVLLFPVQIIRKISKEVLSFVTLNRSTGSISRDCCSCRQTYPSVTCRR